jgi:hypothetical protein
MPFLSFADTKEATPIAIVRGESQNGKVVYLSENKPTSNQKLDIDYAEISKKIKGKDRDKTSIISKISKGLRNGLSSEFLLKEGSEIQHLFETIQKEGSNGSTLKIMQGSQFEVLPTIQTDKRDCVFITGCSGSGKSWWVKKFAENYDRVWGQKRPIYLISKLDEDSTLDNAQCKIHRINLESLLTSPLDINEKEMENCLVIFDDFDTLENTKEKPLLKTVQKLIDDCLIMGRHLNISVCVISHYTSNYKASRIILIESTKIVVYPHACSAHALKYLLGTHVGIDAQEIKNIKRLGSRWVCFDRNYPQIMYSENQIKLLNVE